MLVQVIFVVEKFLQIQYPLWVFSTIIGKALAGWAKGG
jgi:hypothetical protein